MQIPGLHASPAESEGLEAHSRFQCSNLRSLLNRGSDSGAGEKREEGWW